MHRSIKPLSCLIPVMIAFAALADNKSPATIRFVENKGQWHDAILYRLKFNAGTLFLEKDKLTWCLFDPKRFQRHHYADDDSLIRGHVFKVHFENCNPQLTTEGVDSYSDYENYFIGSDPARWASGVKVFRSVNYKNLYPRIDLVFEEYQGHLKYSFIIRPGGNPENISMRFEGVESIYLQDNILHYTTTVNSIREENLNAYQEINGRKVEVPCSFHLHGERVSFKITGQYDRSLPLVIDPVLVFGTFTGSLADNFGYTATYDSHGNFYAGGIARDIGYVTTPGAFQATFAGGANVGLDYDQGYDADITITKFDSAGTMLLYSTYLGGSVNEQPHSLIVGANDELLIYGRSNSPNFPTTAGAYDRSINGNMDIVVTRLNAAGTALLASTFIGGSADDGVNITMSPRSYYSLKLNYADDARGEINLDDAGNVYVVSSTRSSNFPVTTGAFQNTLRGGQDACVFKMNGTLSSLHFSTFLGGSGDDAGYGIFLDNNNQPFVCGGTASNDFPTTANTLYPSYRGGATDGYVAHLNSNGTALLASTYIGTGEDDQTHFVQLDGSENVFVTGQTAGAFPVTAGVYSNPNSGQYIMSLTPTLSSILFSTVFGKGDGDPDLSPTAFLVDVCGNIYFSGWGGRVNSNVDFNINSLPVTSDAFQSSTDGSDFYFFVLSPNAQSLLYASYFGGSFSAEHVDGGTSRFDKNGVIYQAVCAGCGGFSDFPTTPGAWSSTNQSIYPSPNCNEGAAKFQFELIGVEVEVVALPSSTGCVPLTVNFIAGGVNAINYWWDFGDGTTSTLQSPVHTYNIPGIYEVTLIGIDSTTCENLIFSDTSQIAIVARDDSIAARFDPIIISNCDSFIVQMDDNSLNAAGYIWNFGDGTSSTDASPSHRYNSPGVYDISLIITNSAKCNPSDTIVKTVEMIPQIDAAIAVPDTFGCVPFTVNFTDASVGGVSFHWDFGDGNFSMLKNPVHTYSDTGIYRITLIVTDSASCNINDTAAAIVRVSDNKVVAGFALDTLAFECDSLVISLTNESSNYSSFLWDFGDGDTSQALNPVHTYSSSDSFTVRLFVFSPIACNNADTSYEILFLPERVRAAFDADNGCPPHDVSIVNQSSNAASYLWRWWNGSTADSVPVLTNLSSGNYSLTLTAYNSASCNDSSTVTGTFTVHDVPVALFTVDDSVYNLFEPVRFTNQSTGALIYAWAFDDGDSSFIENPIHAYSDSGTYVPCLKVTSAYGCDSTYCTQLDVVFRGAIDVPNAFSPNGDGKNDMLYVRGTGVRDVEFKIYNRWGELVFESTDPDIVCNELDVCEARAKGWDGTYKGKPQEMDVYVFTLHAVFVNGKSSEMKKGNITLLR